MVRKTARVDPLVEDLDPLHKALATALQALGLRNCSNLKSLLRRNQRGFLKDPAIRIADHFEPSATFLVIDASLGTVALIYDVRNCLAKPRGGAKSPTDDEIQKLIQNSCYVRHLLVGELHQETQRNQRSIAIAVEAILLCNQEDEGTLQGVLRSLDRRGQFREAIHGIGIGLLPAQSDPLNPFPEAKLRRAFPWLLRACSDWYKDLTKYEDYHSCLSLELVNYRLAGTRTVEFATETLGRKESKKVPVHLVIGANGTGKSAIAEALELAVCGDAERLRSSASLSAVIAFDKDKDAKVILRRALLEESEHLVPSSPKVTNPLGKGLRATSFRLDQSVMDRLTHPWNKGVVRAKTFLESFFPDDSVELNQHAGREEAVAKAFEVLPESLKGFPLSGGLAEKVEAVLCRFAWVKADPTSTRLPEGALKDCLPLPLGDLEELAKFDEVLLASVEKLKNVELLLADLNTEAKTIDEGIARAIHGLAFSLEKAIEVLSKVGAWHVKPGAATKGDFAKVLNNWLEHRALADIGKRALELVKIVAAIESRGALEKAGPLKLFHIASKKELEEFARQVTAWMEADQQLFDHVLALDANKESREGVLKESLPPPILAFDEIQALNSVGQVLGAPNLGSTINGAIAQGEPVRLERKRSGEIEIGRFAGWADGLLKQLDALRGVAERLRELSTTAATPEDASWRIVERLKRFKAALSTAEDLRAGEKKINEVFLRKVLGNRLLSNALNELLALLTPARWAYQDIELEHVPGMGEPKVEYRYGDSPIDTRLNTAELNLFTVALFLLCAPNQPNPLRLLVLDDPLQNMDELTVTTLARGLARLTRLEHWPEDWQLLILLHGEEDLERLRQEIPAAVYRLPWQSPLELGASHLVKAEERESTHNAELQDLSKVIRAQ